MQHILLKFEDYLKVLIDLIFMISLESPNDERKNSTMLENMDSYMSGP